jgi:hypothetical protein
LHYLDYPLICCFGKTIQGAEEGYLLISWNAQCNLHVFGMCMALIEVENQVALMLSGIQKFEFYDLPGMRLKPFFEW